MKKIKMPIGKQMRPANIMRGFSRILYRQLLAITIILYCNVLVSATVHWLGGTSIGTVPRPSNTAIAPAHNTVQAVHPTTAQATHRQALPQPSRVIDPWRGKPPPFPDNYLREKAEYAGWRSKFYAALPRLTRKGNTAEVAVLVQWYHQYETMAAACARGDASAKLPPLPAAFSVRAVKRVIAPPPSPEYEKFHGYKIVLPWNGAVYYYRTDNIPLKSPFLLHPNGVKDSGIAIRTRPDIHQLFACAGITDPYAKDVLIKVSQLEGGFDAVNSWDTGYVSVGFLQFTAGASGDGHSLLHVLERMKRDEGTRCAEERGHRSEFTRFFSAHGIDVHDGHLYVRDPYSGKTFTGADAVNLLIKDKRLIAIFQDAGKSSRAFQLAQIREAYGSYYLANSPVRIPVAEVCVYEAKDNQTTTPNNHLLPTAGTNDADEKTDGDTPAPKTPPQPVRPTKKRYVYGELAVRMALAQSLNPRQLQRGVLSSRGTKPIRVAQRLPDLRGTFGDVLRSEGGRVTLTDRAVQHGVRNAVETFVAGISKITSDHPLTLQELSAYEDELIIAIRNRVNVLSK